MKIKNHIKPAIIAFSLIAMLTVATTLAFLTDTETAENTVTVGNVQLQIVEDNYREQNVHNSILVPNQIVSKDHKVKNIGINDEIVFLSVTVPVKEVTLIDEIIHQKKPKHRLTRS